MIRTTKVYIHGGDYDCSEAVRMCYRAANVLPHGSYMWTGNEIVLLTNHGFVEVNKNAPQVGDVLWREGHTEMYLGQNKIGGARHGDQGLTGRKGDQDGTEIARSTYNARNWTKCFRYTGPLKQNGIPAVIIALQVMNHLIDNNHHGYSQPNRAGDGTIEEITIRYDDGIEDEVTDADLKKIERMIDAKLDTIPKRVWSFKNDKLERVDVYQILRDIRTALGINNGQTLTEKCIKFKDAAIHKLGQIWANNR